MAAGGGASCRASGGRAALAVLLATALAWRAEGGGPLRAARSPLAVMPRTSGFQAMHRSVRCTLSFARYVARPAAHRPLRVGIDTEWMDGEGEARFHSLRWVPAVEQRRVIDALPRADEEEGDTRSALGGLLRWLLDEADASDVTLLGFAFAGDMAVLRPLIGASPPHCSPTQCPRNLIDVQALARLRGEDTPSLKKVCARTIGQRLDKTEQCSDWGRRPLRREQLRYAALDALILIFVHDSLVSKASSH